MVRQTRGKTKPNRHSLWLAWFAEQYNQLEPFCDRSIIDLGYGEKPYSVFELHEASRGFSSPPSIIGVESAHHRHRQALAERHPEISFILDETVEFSRYRPPPKLIRALNVLRQYPPHEVASIRRGWLATSPGDVLLTEGTTDRDGDTLAMWCQSNDAPSTLVFGVSGRRGFAPNQLRAVLPNDLRWLHPKPAWLERLFEDWTLAWATTDASEESIRRFTTSIERLSTRQPTWVRIAPAFWARGLVEFYVDDIVADTSR